MVNVIGLLRGLTSITPRVPAQKLDSLTGKPGAKSSSKPPLKVQAASKQRPRRGPEASPVRPCEPANEPMQRD